MQGATVTDTLRRVPLFKALPDDKLAWISDHGQEIHLEAGTKIASQGNRPDGLYVVLEGETEWTRRVGDKDFFVASLGEGSIFAELIMVLDAPYPTTGHASTPVRLLKLDRPEFWEMLKICPEVLRGILATSVERAELHESISQKHAKLVSLGTMAAGLAHELNNPAAAAARSAQEAREVFRESSAKAVKLGALEMSPDQRAFVAGLPEEVSSPTPTRVGESSHASSTPRSSSQRATSSSRSLRSSESRASVPPDRSATSVARLATNALSAGLISISLSFSARTDDSRKTSRVSSALRPTAAAGLLSSWARPAAMVPKEMSLACCWETDSCSSARSTEGARMPRKTSGQTQSISQKEGTSSLKRRTCLIARPLLR